MNRALLICSAAGLAVLLSACQVDSTDNATEAPLPLGEQQAAASDDNLAATDSLRLHSFKASPFLNSEPGPAILKPVQGDLGDGVAVDLSPAEPVVEPPSRARRRMDVDQLEASIKQVTGGLTWTIGNNSQFEALAQTLGKPNYIDLTAEDLEPAALFQKFLDDAARQVCDKLVEQESKVTLDPHILMLHAGAGDQWAEQPDKIKANLQHLVLRFHGRYLDTDAPEMEQWRWLYESAEFVSQDPVKAWRTVCVGLIVHPFFYTY
ncbi:MAG: hypothetical protein ACI9WU_004420 [Myxococcota bacterium]|jgi:hypothetical protein